MRQTSDAADLLQRRAADPSASVWVAASAGTGKTKVLTDRVLTLLLSGNPPSRILCLTFTRAAAAEMANRLHRELGRWATQDDAALVRSLSALLGGAPDAPQRAKARRLFAEVLDAPGGLAIETIHAFCQSLLRRFPLEAGVVPHFELMDERAMRELLVSVREEVLARARSEPHSPLAHAVAELERRVGESRFQLMLDKIAEARRRFRALAERPGGIARGLADLAGRLGIEATASEASIVEAACQETTFDGAALRAAAEAMTVSKAKGDQKAGMDLADWLAGPANRARNFSRYLRVFFTQDGDARATIMTRGLARKQPMLEAALRAECQRLDRVRGQLAAAAQLRATAATTELALEMLRAYEAQKRHRALLDYEDLIQHSLALLQRPGVAPWVLFKLDGGLDHLLVDEAQDTSPEQWSVVERLTEEFYVGAGARERIRTVFAVGDAKQSIFSFQGADPEAFLRMRRHFAERTAQAKGEWRALALETSFRSTDAVLAAVDAVFAAEDARDGVIEPGETIRHRAHRQEHAGRVELWPLVEPPREEPAEGWLLPLEQRTEAEPAQRLAIAIAATIKGWLARGERLPARGRLIQARDIMVLVRRRGSFVGALVRAMKERGVPAAGVDRMRLTEQLAVEDMMALGHLLLLPEDDLTLATVLKGPLFNFDEDRLFALAHGRERSLWLTLLARREEDPMLRAAAETLQDLMRRADFAPPYELFSMVLGALGGRRRILARLGADAADPLDEFLAAALAYERDHPPSLQGFLHWLAAGAAEVKRDLDQGVRDEVRVLTVHGSKGLEAPIVFLPDTTAMPDRIDDLQWIKGGLPLWLAKGARMVPLATAARGEAELRRDREYRRLLYVAMTRAADRLIVCGWKQRRNQSTGCWYELVRQGLATVEGVRAQTYDLAAVAGEAIGWSGAGLLLDTPQRVFPRDDEAPPSEAELSRSLPEWAQRPPPAEPKPPKPLAPSRPLGIEPALRSPLGPDLGRRFERGLLIHRLLQNLPDLAPERRRGAAMRFLALPMHALDRETQGAILDETMAVLEHPDCAPFFVPDSAAEVPVVGLIGGQALAGQIDRLVVRPDEVLILDYKSLRPAPHSIEEVPALYLDQLASYRRAVGAIYSGRRIRAAILWTDGPRLMAIDAALLDGRLTDEPQGV